MSTTSKIVLIMTCLGSLVAFGFCLIIHVLNTMQPLFNALEVVQ
jgi:hypothetical protein